MCDSAAMLHFLVIDLMSPRLEIFKTYRATLVWPVNKPAPKFFSSAQSKTHFFI